MVGDLLRVAPEQKDGSRLRRGESWCASISSRTFCASTIFANAHATLMLLKGVHPKIVAERLGHASIGITLDTYSHVLPSMQHEAAEAVDELFAGAVSGS